MEPVTILVIPKVPDHVLTRIKQVNPSLKVLDARAWFDVEIRTTWPKWTVDRYLGTRPSNPSTPEERTRALAAAEVILIGWPPLKDLRKRAPFLKWVHQLPAGASNLLNTDLWGSDVLVTTSRGRTNTRPMAEYVLAAFLHFARGLHVSYRDQRRHAFVHYAYDPVLLRDKTVCVVGAGGIGQEVAKLCAAVGMRVVGTRRHSPPGTRVPKGFARLEAATSLYDLIRESDFIAVCCPWTKETTNLIGQKAFAAMRPGTVLVNIARGEIIDEAALITALAEGKLRGVALDVYVGEFEHPPDSCLWDDERVIVTPHISAGTDLSEHRGVDLFCDNLALYLEGRPLKNIIDWDRGY